MVSKSFVLAVAGATVAQAACEFPYVAQLPGNSVFKPSTVDTPTIGEPYSVSYNGTKLGPKLTFALLRGPGENIIETGYIGTDVPNCGSSLCTWTWTPDPSLEPDTTHYGIKMIDQTSCKYQYTTQFGLKAGSVTPPKSTTPKPSVSSKPARPIESLPPLKDVPKSSEIVYDPKPSDKPYGGSKPDGKPEDEDCEDESPSGYASPSSGYKTNGTTYGGYTGVSAGVSPTYTPLQSNDATSRFAISAFGAVVAFATAIMVL